jgi:hypothetical protein
MYINSYVALFAELSLAAELGSLLLVRHSAYRLDSFVWAFTTLLTVSARRLGYEPWSAPLATGIFWLRFADFAAPLVLVLPVAVLPLVLYSLLAMTALRLALSAFRLSCALLVLEKSAAACLRPWHRLARLLLPCTFLLAVVSAGDPQAAEFVLPGIVGTYVAHTTTKRRRDEDGARQSVSVEPKPYVPTKFHDRPIRSDVLASSPVTASEFITPSPLHEVVSFFDSENKPYHPKYVFLQAKDPALRLRAARMLTFADQHPSVAIKAYDYVSAALALELGLHHRSTQHHATFPQLLISAGTKLSNALRSTLM